MTAPTTTEPVLEAMAEEYWQTRPDDEPMTTRMRRVLQAALEEATEECPYSYSWHRHKYILDRLLKAAGLEREP